MSSWWLDLPWVPDSSLTLSDLCLGYIGAIPIRMRVATMDVTYVICKQSMPRSASLCGCASCPPRVSDSVRSISKGLPPQVYFFHRVRLILAGVVGLYWKTRMDTVQCRWDRMTTGIQYQIDGREQNRIQQDCELSSHQSRLT